MVMQTAGLVLDLETGELGFEGRVANASRREMAVLRVLASRPGEVVSRDEIRAMAGPGVDGNPRTVDVYVSRVRRRLRSVGHPRIASVFQRGYRLLEA